MSFAFDSFKSHVFQAAKQLGIKKFDLYGSFTEKNASGSKEGKPFAVSSAQNANIKLRIWNDKNQVGMVKTSDLTFAGLLKSMHLAYESALLDSYEEKADFSPTQFSQKKIINDDTQLSDISLLISAAIENENYILSKS
ncbi:MAG: hypothetical protein K2X39_01875, partial [Silvanigrellaceae bacterium]|nr:hypothetical protein [Silvanigrellaceae bacterium]